MIRPDDPEPVNVTLIDTAQSKIGAGLRALFEPVMQADVPPNLTSLAETLESRLDATADRDGPTDEAVAEQEPPVPSDKS